MNSSARCKKLGGLLASSILLAATHLTDFPDINNCVNRRSDRLVMLAFEAQPVLMVPTSPRCLRYFRKGTVGGSRLVAWDRARRAHVDR